MDLVGTLSELQLRYSEDGVTWTSYKESGSTKDEVRVGSCLDLLIEKTCYSGIQCYARQGFVD